MATERVILPDRACLPSLPHLYARLCGVLDDPNAPASRIAEILGQDAALTARLLRLVNSAFYGFPYRIETVSRAVLIVGTRQIADLALATLVTRLFEGLPRGLVDMERFWLHGIATAVTARVLATYRREANVERFFVAGVLHDVGRLLIYTHAPDRARQALLESRQRGELLLRVEREVLGCDHGAAGAELVRAWGLPAVLEEAVAFHHEPTGARQHPTEAAVVHVADVLAHALEIGSGGERLVPPLDPAAWERTGLSPRILGEVLDHVDRQVRAAAYLVQPAVAA